MEVECRIPKSRGRLLHVSDLGIMLHPISRLFSITLRYKANVIITSHSTLRSKAFANSGVVYRMKTGAIMYIIGRAIYISSLRAILNVDAV